VRQTLEIAGAATARRCRAGDDARIRDRPDWLPGVGRRRLGHRGEHGPQARLVADVGLGPLACFALLWALRKHPYQIGWLFSAYLALACIERLLIEQIRVNPVLDFGIVHLTQAELNASSLIMLGLVGIATMSQRTLSPGVSSDIRTRPLL
jgi:hypothetical protein